jgi:hypothetical protein
MKDTRLTLLAMGISDQHLFRRYMNALSYSTIVKGCLGLASVFVLEKQNDAHGVLMTGE